ncbi:MAG: hypothetical protein WBW14_26480, partial [Candidatus Acidiferrum sp.]
RASGSVVEECVSFLRLLATEVALGIAGNAPALRGSPGARRTWWLITPTTSGRLRRGGTR